MAEAQDRVANPWGERTPFGPGEEWPVRVDAFLDAGVSEEEVDRWVRSASILHSNGDALDIAVKDGRIVGVRGRGEDRVNHGRLGPKDLFGWQANSSEDRLKRPLVRKDGDLVEASWDEAMGRVVERSRELLEEKGPLAFGFYTTGQFFLEEYYTLGVIGKAGLGTPHMDGNTRLCTATAGQAMKESFGTDGQPGSYTDIDHADAILLFGHNVAETQTVLWMRMLDRLEGEDPPQFVVVDPRPTPPARRADVHLAIKNRTNVALLNAILREVIENGWFDEGYVEARTVGFEELKETVSEYTPEKAAEICGVAWRRETVLYAFVACVLAVVVSGLSARASGQPRSPGASPPLRVPAGIRWWSWPEPSPRSGARGSEDRWSLWCTGTTPLGPLFFGCGGELFVEGEGG